VSKLVYTVRNCGHLFIRAWKWRFTISLREEELLEGPEGNSGEKEQELLWRNSMTPTKKRMSASCRNRGRTVTISWTCHSASALDFIWNKAKVALWLRKF
jgi:hypothetical protein